MPAVCAYITERLTSGRVADTGANVGEPAVRLKFLYCAAWQTLFAAAGAGSWLAWQHPCSGVGRSGPGSWSFGRGGQGSWGLWRWRSWGFGGWRGISGAWLPGSGLRHSLSGHAWWQYLLAAAALLTVWLAMCRSPTMRLLASTAGVLAVVEAANQKYNGTPAEAVMLPAAQLLWAAAALLAASGLAYQVRQETPAPRVATPQRAPSVQPLQRTATPAQQTLRSLSRALSPRAPMFGGKGRGSADLNVSWDAGHFVVQPGGNFHTPIRSPLGNMLARVSALLGQASLPAPPPLPPKPWLDDEHRSISISFFTDPGPLGLKVRGPNYLSDKKKVEAEGTEAELLSVDLLDVAPTFHIARHLPAVLHSRAPFMFVMQVMVPGTPKLSLTTVWSLPYDPKGEWAPETPFARSLRAFLDGDDAERGNIFKLIPRVEKGSWIVKQAVGQNTPVLLGKKLTTKYFSGPNYIEVDVDVGSSSSASSVVGLVAGAVKNLVIDMAVVLQANDVECLPESLLGTMRLNHLDLSAAPWLDTDNNLIVPKDQEPPACVAAAPATPAKTGWLSRRQHQSTPALQDLRKDSHSNSSGHSSKHGDGDGGSTRRGSPMQQSFT